MLYIAYSLFHLTTLVPFEAYQISSWLLLFDMYFYDFKVDLLTFICIRHLN